MYYVIIFYLNIISYSSMLIPKALRGNFKYLLLSIFSFLFSYFPLLIPEEERTMAGIVFGASLLYLAVISLSEFVTREWGNFSQVKEIIKHPKSIIVYIFVGFLGGVLLDGVVQWTARLWIYPWWSTTFYIFIFTAGFSIYYLCIICSYLVVKVIIDKLRKGKRYITRPKKILNVLFFVILIVSVMLLIVGSSGLILGFYESGYLLFDVGVPTESEVSFIFVVLFMTGAWLLIEYLGFVQGKNTFIKEIVHGYYDSLLAVLLASLVLLIIMESQNGPIQLWTYQNWPLQEIQLFYTPIVAIFSWPFHYLLIISLYKTVSRDQTKNILEGDKID